MCVVCMLYLYLSYSGSRRNILLKMLISFVELSEIVRDQGAISPKSRSSFLSTKQTCLGANLAPKGVSEMAPWVLFH